MEFTSIASSSAGCAYVVRSGINEPLLIDAGVSFDIIQKALDFKVTSLAGVLISHAHGDHMKSVAKLLQSGVNGYASRETWAAVMKAPRPRPIPSHRAKVIEEDTISIGHWRVRAFDCVHDLPGTIGFIIADGQGQKLLYLTDSAYSKYTFDGLTHIAVECNWSSEILGENAGDGRIDASRARRTVRTHMSLERLIDMLKANDLSKVEEIHLLHLSDQNSDEDKFRRAVQKATGKPVYIAAKGALV